MSRILLGRLGKDILRHGKIMGNYMVSLEKRELVCMRMIGKMETIVADEEQVH